MRRRLDYLVRLGVDALWLSPFYPSPLADSGYDITDHCAVDPAYGALEDFDLLVAEAHVRGLRVLLDLVPSHTSIEHPWFREHPDWYVWADRPNNWIAAFGGSAWTRDERTGRWYLHSFYPEQPDLNWRNPEVVRAVQAVVRFWLERGVDGFRIDAVDHLMKDPELRDDPPARAPYALPLHEEQARLEHRHSRNHPDIGLALAALREAAGDALLVAEAYVPTADLAAYLEHMDLAFAFELLHSPWEAARLRELIEAATGLERVAWVISNHDFPRMPTRFGPENVRLAAMLLLTLPGTAFVYQGDEIGMADGPGGDPPVDRAGRDAHRHPMQWDRSPTGGFTTGRPWLPLTDPGERNVADQEGDPQSLLSFYRELIGLRRRLGPGLRMLESEPGVLAYERGDHAVALNLTDEPRRVPTRGEVALATVPGAGERGTLPPRTGSVVRVVA